MTELKALEVFFGSMLAVLPRTVGVFALLPFLPQSLPQFVVRSGLGLTVAIFFQPIALEWAGWVKLDGISLFLFTLKEIFIGILISLGLGVIWQAVATAGAIVDTSAGTANGSLLDPTTNQEQGLWASSYGLIASVLIVLFGGIPLTISALVWSYAAFPIGEWLTPNLSSLIQLANELGGSLLQVAMMVAAPFIVVLGLLDLMFGLLSRQIQQFSGSQMLGGIKTMACILLLLIGLGSFAEFVLQKQNAQLVRVKQILTPR